LEHVIVEFPDRREVHVAMRTIDPAWTPNPVTIDPALRAEVCATSASR